MQTLGEKQILNVKKDRNLQNNVQLKFNQQHNVKIEQKLRIYSKLESKIVNIVNYSQNYPKRESKPRNCTQKDKQKLQSN